MTDGSAVVLATRLTELAEDVTTVQGVLERLLVRGSHLDKLKYLVTPRLGGKTVTLPLRDAAEQANRLADAAQNEPGLADALRYERVDVDKLARYIAEAQQRLREVAQVINSMAVFDLQQYTDALMTNLEVCGDVISQIGELQRRLGTGTAPREIWLSLDELHAKSCRALFADYVDLLSGMVLRDTHLDDEICAITDDFLADLASPRLVLPARRSELPTLLDSLVKIGFPEWTVWDVPLAAHHAGVWRAERRLPNEAALRESLPGRPDEVRRCLFADIYATQAAGPAYICAMLLLRLNPAPPAAAGPGTATDHERAYVILKALRFAEPPDAFTAFVKRVGSDWNDAVTQNAGSGPAPLNAAELDEFAERACESLRQAKVAAYDVGKWQSANDRLRPLLLGASTEPAEGHIKVLDLLNVAWTLRREAAAGSATLQSRVMSLWLTGGGRDGRPPPDIYRNPPPPEGRHG